MKHNFNKQLSKKSVAILLVITLVICMMVPAIAGEVNSSNHLYEESSEENYEELVADSEEVIIADLSNEAGEEETTQFEWHPKHGMCGESVNWVFEDGVLMISGTGPMSNSFIIGYYGEGPWNYYNREIQSIVIEEGVTSIGSNLFRNCSNATSIIIPSSVRSIGSYAFSGCKSLSSISIPSTVTSIGDYAFEESGITSLEIPSSVTSLGNEIIYNCNNLQKVYCHTKPSDFSVYSYIFVMGNLSCSFDLYLYSYDGWDKYSASAVNQRLFVDQGLYYAPVYLDGQPLKYVTGSCGANLSWELENGKLVISGSGDMYDFDNRMLPWKNYINEISSVEIEEGVTSIGIKAFNGLPGLKSVTIPNSIKKIGAYSFADCRLLTNIVLNNSVKEIGDCAFKSSGITSIEIPSSVTKIGKDILDLCISLRKVECYVSPAKITTKTFSTIPNGVDYDLYIYSRNGWTQFLAGCKFYDFTEATVYLDGVKIELEPGSDPGDVSGDVSGDASGDAMYHSHISVIDPAVEATCLQTGLTQGSHCSECGEVIIPQRVIPTQGHKGVVDKAIQPTCTVTGLTEGSHCEICGTVITSQKVVPVKDHTKVVDPAVAPTCIKTGLTEGSHCKDCGLVLVKQNVINVTDHKWDSGKVTKAASLVEDGVKEYHCINCDKSRTEIIPRLKEYRQDGIGNTPALDGNWYYFENNQVALKVTTVAENSLGWWYVKNGKVDFNYAGVAGNSNGIWYIKNGKVDFSFKGFFTQEGVTMYFEGGQLKGNKTEVIFGNANGTEGWWNVVNGKVKPGPTVAWNSNGWWYIDKIGKVDFNFRGLEDNENGTWYLEGGKVNFGKTDVLNCSYHGKSAWWNIAGGMLKSGITIAYNSNGWWYIDEAGKVDFNFQGLAENENGVWYCDGGKVLFDKTDIINCSYFNETAWWNIAGGKLKKGPTVEKNSFGWWYIDKTGKVDFDYTGIATNSNGSWLIIDGKVDFSFDGVFDGKTFQGGRVIK